MEKAVGYAESLEFSEIFAGKAWSLTTILKEIHQALNENRPEFYTVAQSRDLIAQEFLLFENTGSDDLEDVVDIAPAHVNEAINYRMLDRQIWT